MTILELAIKGITEDDEDLEIDDRDLYVEKLLMVNLWS